MRDCGRSRLIRSLSSSLNCLHVQLGQVQLGTLLSVQMHHCLASSRTEVHLVQIAGLLLRQLTQGQPMSTHCSQMLVVVWPQLQPS